MSDLALLRHHAKILVGLLENPEPGLAAWRTAYEYASRQVLAFYGVDIEKIRETWDSATPTVGELRFFPDKNNPGFGWTIRFESDRTWTPLDYVKQSDAAEVLRKFKSMPTTTAERLGVDPEAFGGSD